MNPQEKEQTTFAKRPIEKDEQIKEGYYDTNIGKCYFKPEKGYGWHRSGVEWYLVEVMKIALQSNDRFSFQSELIKFRDWIEVRLAPQPTYCITESLIREYIQSLTTPNGREEKIERLEEKIRNIIQEMRDESLVDFMRASDREKVVKRLKEFIESQI